MVYTQVRAVSALTTHELVVSRQVVKKQKHWVNHRGQLGNRNPTEKSSLITYHPSFMVYWWVLIHFGPFLPTQLLRSYDCCGTKGASEQEIGFRVQVVIFFAWRQTETSWLVAKTAAMAPSNVELNMSFLQCLPLHSPPFPVSPPTPHFFPRCNCPYVPPCLYVRWPPTLPLPPPVSPLFLSFLVAYAMLI